MLGRNWILRDRTHPFNTDIRWWIDFQEIQIHTRRNCDHNRIHWMGHCDQQPYLFLKLIPLLHVSLVTLRSSPMVVVFKMCVASWSGWVRTALSETFFISNLLWGAFRMSLIIQEMKITEKNKNKINKTFHSADDRRRAADKKRGQPASSSWGHLQCTVGEIMGFPELITETSD